ncbi:hypothetical protein M3Y99_00744300 [Aphelenchoides fujianensis]|nr:hypothetical protein M3Y99_00744300 [Aphelenchoides fujianensis]
MTEIAASSLNTAAELSTTAHTVEWVLRMLVEHNPKFEAARNGAKVEELTAYDISEGKGYLSRVYKCTARFDRPQSAAYSFIMKIPTFDCLATAMEDMQLDKEAAHKFEAELRCAPPTCSPPLATSPASRHKSTGWTDGAENSSPTSTFRR